MEWWVFALVKIMVINIILSGDNAIVIAMASRKLPRKQRRMAIFWGAFIAVALRVILTIIALQLLKIPYLTAIGALLLVWIAVKLISNGEEQPEVRAGNTLYNVIMTIVVADFVMSLDNVIAIAAVAEENLLLITLGIVTSIPLIIWGSQIILHLIEKIPAIIYVGAGILGFTAGEMLLKDQEANQLIQQYVPIQSWFLPLLLAIAVMMAGWINKNRRVDRPLM